jgi:arsenate reductase
MLTIYHNPRCRKSREGLQYLRDKGYEHEVMEYLTSPLTEDQLRKLLMKLNLKPAEVVRTQETLYRKELKSKAFTDDEWIRIIIQHPVLLRRPIVAGRYRAVIAQPPEKIEEVVRH